MDDATTLAHSKGEQHLVPRQARLDVAVGDAARVAELQRNQQLLQQAARLDLRQAPPLRATAETDAASAGRAIDGLYWC